MIKCLYIKRGHHDISITTTIIIIDSNHFLKKRKINKI